MIRKANPDTDQISRSLLQKAVRRGYSDITCQVANYLIQINDFDWLRKRLAVITFEECWAFGNQLTFANDEETVIEDLITITKTIKNKNAAGLGSLAYALSQGDMTVLGKNPSENKAIRIIAEGIKRPNDFWKWIKNQNSNETNNLFVKKAECGFKRAGWIWDRAFTQAAAYLAIFDELPKTEFSNTKKKEFPFWIGIDKHTRRGKDAIKEAAKQVSVEPQKALWLAFYFESARCNSIENSPWWDKEIEWRMKKLNLSAEEGSFIWDKIKPILIELLKNDADVVKEKILSCNYQTKQKKLRMD